MWYGLRYKLGGMGEGELLDGKKSEGFDVEQRVDYSLFFFFVFINPLGPIRQKSSYRLVLLHGIAPLLTLLPPPRTPAKLGHFRSTFFKQLARSIFFLYTS